MIFNKISSLFSKGHPSSPETDDETKRKKLFWQLLAEQFHDKSIVEHQDYAVLAPKDAVPIIVNREKKMYEVGPVPRRLLYLRLHPIVNYVHLESVRRGHQSLDDTWGKCYLLHCDAFIGKYAESKPFLEFDMEGNPRTHLLENKITKVVREVFEMKYDSPLIFDYEKFCNLCGLQHLNSRIEKMDKEKESPNDDMAYGI